jgi:hypothetical protein
MNRITTRAGLLYRNGQVIHLPEADSVAIAYGFSCAERFVRALQLILVVARTQIQLRIFADNCGFSSIQIKRVRTDRDVRGRNPDRPLLLLPRWYVHEGSEAAVEAWKQRKGKTVDISEAMVLGKVPFDYSLLA